LLQIQQYPSHIAAFAAVAAAAIKTYMIDIKKKKALHLLARILLKDI
jgi:hypothetical protein